MDKDYNVFDLDIVRKNDGAKYIASRRTGDAWCKQGRVEFPFLALREPESLLALPPATPEPDKAVAVEDVPKLPVQLLIKNTNPQQRRRRMC